MANEPSVFEPLKFYCIAQSLSVIYPTARIFPSLVYMPSQTWALPQTASTFCTVGHNNLWLSFSKNDLWELVGIDLYFYTCICLAYSPSLRKIQQIRGQITFSCIPDKDIHVFYLDRQFLSHPCYLTQDRIKITFI